MTSVANRSKIKKKIDQVVEDVNIKLFEINKQRIKLEKQEAKVYKSALEKLKNLWSELTKIEQSKI